jgi:glucose 1-dehydrogenase
MQDPDFSVKDRRVLVTGAGRGIGLAMAQVLANNGASVIIQDIDRDIAQREVEQLVDASRRAVALSGDLSDPQMPDRLIEESVAALGGPVDILINNGSIQSRAPFVDVSPVTMRREYEANVVTPARLCQLVLPKMVEKRWGRIINLGSIQGSRGFETMASYAMTRASLSNLTKSLAKKYASSGITVNCIAPGWFDTFRNAGNFKDIDEKQERGKAVPVGRIGEPVDCAGLCLLLCSAAGEYITGQTMLVDGGLSL